MEISKMFEDNKGWQENFSRTDFAHLDKENGIFIIRNTPYPALPWQNLDIGLKNVAYKIYKGVLYIKGTRIYHYNLPNLFLDFYSFEKSPYYEICHENNDKLVIPFVETDICIKRWWRRKNKWVKGVDVWGLKPLNWHLAKQKDPFEFAMSSFKLREK